MKFICPICDKEFGSLEDFRSHVEVVHRIPAEKMNEFVRIEECGDNYYVSAYFVWKESGVAEVNIKGYNVRDCLKRTARFLSSIADALPTKVRKLSYSGCEPGAGCTSKIEVEFNGLEELRKIVETAHSTEY